METIKKMILVPADASNQFPVPKPQLPQPEALQLSRLDSELKEILDDTSIPSDAKLKLYSHVLHQHGAIVEAAKKPKQVEIKKVKASLTHPSARELVKDLPAQKHETASRLASFLEKNDSIRWNTKSELLIDGVAIRGSHISDLFDWAIRDRVSEAHKPPGFDKFFEKLQDANVPLTAIGNKHLKAVIQNGRGRHQMKRSVIRNKRFQWQNLYK